MTRFRVSHLAGWMTPELFGGPTRTRTWQGRFWRPTTAPAVNPDWRSALLPPQIPVKVRTGFQPVPALRPIYAPKWRRADESNTHEVSRVMPDFKAGCRPCGDSPGWRMAEYRNSGASAPHLFSKQRQATCLLHLPIWQTLYDLNLWAPKRRHVSSVLV